MPEMGLSGSEGGVALIRQPYPIGKASKAELEAARERRCHTNHGLAVPSNPVYK